MIQWLWITIAALALAMGAFLAIWLMFQLNQAIKINRRLSPRGVVKEDWLPTGRIDFATRLNKVTDQNKDRPDELKLLVEERRVVESITGNENLEFQWRLATLTEAKTVVSHYHKISDNTLIKSTPELSSIPPMVGVRRSAEDEISIIPSTNGGSEPVPHSV